MLRIYFIWLIYLNGEIDEFPNHSKFNYHSLSIHQKYN